MLLPTEDEMAMSPFPCAQHAPPPSTRLTDGESDDKGIRVLHLSIHSSKKDNQIKTFKMRNSF
jgi:hypothetical protein